MFEKNLTEANVTVNSLVGANLFMARAMNDQVGRPMVIGMQVSA